MAIAVQGITMSRELRELFSSAGRLQVKPATITNNLDYILALEYGSSKGQAPFGMYRRQINAFGYILDETMRAAFEEHGVTQQALDQGINEAALRILVKLVEATPVDTGRAKGAWVARLNTGQDFPGAQPISAAQQVAIRRAKSRRIVREMATAARKVARIQARQARRRPT